MAVSRANPGPRGIVECVPPSLLRRIISCYDLDVVPSRAALNRDRIDAVQLEVR